MNKEEILTEMNELEESASNAGRHLFATQLAVIAGRVDAYLVDMEPAD